MLGLAGASARAQEQENGIIHQPWEEIQTTHFHVYSCGPRQAVAQVAARLEQFRAAYGLLAGAQAVAAPPITVMVFANHKVMEPFLPEYNGQPANLSGFFKPGPEENLILMELIDGNAASMNVIFHEYTHFLLRNNENIWPLWLQEGMAEIYSTFESYGRGVRIGKPIPYHLRLMEQTPLLPLAELFAVGHDSPNYNESAKQGIFYAESWLLTHYLMNGDNAVLKARFGNFTKYLRLGQAPEQAFTNALRVSLPVLDNALKNYLKRGQFESIGYVVPVDLSGAQGLATRPIGTAEACFRLGNELMRIDRLDAAEKYFNLTKKLAPNGPQGFEGLGLLASEREQMRDSISELKKAFEHGSANYLAYYICAQEQLRLTSPSKEEFTRIEGPVAEEIRDELRKSIGFMPNFGPAHQLLGFFELVQGDNLGEAEQQLQMAIRLEPEHKGYLFELAEAQIQKRDFSSARKTLELLRQPTIDTKLRAQADAMLQKLDDAGRKQPR